MKGQYKNAVSIDPASFDASIGLEYERFVFSKNNHHISLRAFAGFQDFYFRFGAFRPGIEALYGYGNNHRIELGLGFSPTLMRFETTDGSNAYLGISTFRVGYAYFAKNNPMFYRVGLMPTARSLHITNDGTNTHWFLLSSIGIGYRF